MQSLVNELVKQATETGMTVNDRKTKEMLIGSILKDKPLSVNFSGTFVERVTTFKLLEVHVANNLKWTQQVDAISLKVSSRLYLLKQLKRSGAGPEDLLCYYITVVRPVLEYACPVWHLSLTAAQTKTLESLRQRAMKIIFPAVKDYTLADLC